MKNITYSSCHLPQYRYQSYFYILNIVYTYMYIYVYKYSYILNSFIKDIYKLNA